jgi:actin-like ATPase involved in cell morphogenesis
MGEFPRRLPLPLLVAGLIAIAVVSMVVDRRAVMNSGRDLPGWLGAVLDVAAPLQKAVAMPFESVRDGWRRYAALLDTQRDNEALAEPINAIVESVKAALERTPPELSADIVDKGIVLVGGGSMLGNLDVLLRESTGLPVMLAEDPLTAVVVGSGHCLDEIRLLKEVKIRS